MAAEVEGAARKPHAPTFSGNGLQYNYDAELAAVLPFNVKIPFDNVTEARRVEAEGMAEQLRARADLPKDPNVLVEDHVLARNPVGLRTSRSGSTPRHVGQLRSGRWSSSMAGVTY